MLGRLLDDHAPGSRIRAPDGGFNGRAECREGGDGGVEALGKGAREARAGAFEAGIEAANMMRKLFHMYEPAKKDEENSYNVDITTDMTIDDVMDEIVNILSKL